jgi:hypothetical protein
MHCHAQPFLSSVSSGSCSEMFLGELVWGRVTLLQTVLELVWVLFTLQEAHQVLYPSRGSADMQVLPLHLWMKSPSRVHDSSGVLKCQRTRWQDRDWDRLALHCAATKSSHLGMLNLQIRLGRAAILIILTFLSHQCGCHSSLSIFPSSFRNDWLHVFNGTSFVFLWFNLWLIALSLLSYYFWFYFKMKFLDCSFIVHRNMTDFVFWCSMLWNDWNSPVGWSHYLWMA